MSGLCSAYVCSHTHWDREWHGSFQEYRYRLVRLMDRLLNLLDDDPDFRCFNLDAQTIAINDYLEIRPENRERLRTAIAAGKLIVGPWTVLPDEFLVSGEATIRNLLKGIRIAESFGRSSSVGYLPDMFGHISQMPQILRGFGIDSAIFWRGLSNDEIRSELWWDAPDGSRVLGIHLPEYCGYCNAAFFPGSLPPEVRERFAVHGDRLAENPDAAADALIEVARRARACSAANVVLLMNGVDHMEPQPAIPEAIRIANERSGDFQFIHASLDEYVAAVKEAISTNLQTVHGELKDTIWSKEGTGIVLPNVLSSRIYLKMANFECQTLLERWTEPVSVMASMMGHPYPAAFLDRAWDWLLENHPHDSIGGCSGDPVHRQMETRFEWSREIGETLLGAATATIASEIDTSELGEREMGLVVFNPQPWPLTGRFDVTLDLEEGWLRANGIHPNSENVAQAVRNLRVFHDSTGEEATVQLLDVRYLLRHMPHAEGFAPIASLYRVSASFIVDSLPPLGYRVYRARIETKQVLLPGTLVPSPNAMENDHLRVEIRPNGSFAILHKRSGTWDTDLGYFVDGGDNGDGYTYSPPRNDSVLTTLSSAPRISLERNGPAEAAYRITHEWPLPVSLTPDRQHRSEETRSVRISSLLRLGANSRIVEIETTVENTVRNHRLRIAFPTRRSTARCAAEGQFDVIERTIAIEQPPFDQWREDQPKQYPQQSFVSMSDGRTGLSVLNRGLPEFEVSDDESKAILITLLRSVAYLGAGSDTNTIAGGAGPRVETPDAQIPRTLNFATAVLPHAGTWDEDGVQREAHGYACGVRSEATGRHDGGGPREASFLSVEGERVALSSLKRAEDGNGWIVRLWNGSDRATHVSLRCRGALSAVRLTDLRERAADDIAIREGVASFDIPAKRIVTARLTVDR